MAHVCTASNIDLLHQSKTKVDECIDNYYPITQYNVRLNLSWVSWEAHNKIWFFVSLKRFNFWKTGAHLFTFTLLGHLTGAVQYSNCCILAFNPAKNAIPRWCTGRKWHILMAVMRGNCVGGNWLMKWDEVKKFP